MKLLWNKKLNNQNLARNRERFLFQAQPESNETTVPPMTVLRNPNTNQEVSQASQDTSYNVSQTIGNWSANRTSDIDFGSTNPGRVDGFLPSENNRRIWNLPRQFWINLFPDRILRNRIVSSLENLNIANQGANGRYTDIQNELHQRCLNNTVRYITTTGADLRHASLADMDIAENIAKSLNEHRQSNIKVGNREGNRILNTRRTFTKISENILPTNWTRKRQFNQMNKNNANRSKQTTANFLAKAVKARRDLNSEVDGIQANIATHKKGWENSNAGAEGQNNTAKQEWHAFVQAVIANPNGFLAGNGGNFAGYNFGAICFPQGNVNRVRMLDTLLLRGAVDEAVEAEQSVQAGRDITATLSNLNEREIASEANIQELEDIPVETLFSRLTDVDTGDNPTTVPENRDLVGNLIWEIIRIERRHDVDFDINTTVFGGQANKMNHDEKISYLINYIMAPANINHFVKNPGLAMPNFSGLSEDHQKQLKAWLVRFRDDEPTATQPGLNETQWTELQANSLDIITDARTALTDCETLSDGFTPTEQATLPGRLGNIEAFIVSFDLFDFATRIGEIPEAQQGVYKGFLSQMTTIKNTLADMVTQIKAAHTAENTRMTQPIPGSVPPVMPTDPADRIALAVSVNLRMNISVDNLLTNLTTGINDYDYPGAAAGADVTYDELRVHLSSESKKSRETQFRSDLDTNSEINWNFWRNPNTIGRVIPLLQGDRINYVSDSTHTINGAFSANNLLVIDNRVNPETGETEVIAQNAGGTELFVIEQDKSSDHSKIIAHRFDVPVAQHGANTLKEVPSINDAAEKIEIYNMAA